MDKRNAVHRKLKSNLNRIERIIKIKSFVRIYQLKSNLNRIERKSGT